MGYTHYWKRKKKYSKEVFDMVARDLKKIVDFLEPIIPLAEGNGEGKATITDESICFNGVQRCGHEKRNLGITWPDDEGYGVSLAYTKELEKDAILALLSGEHESLSLGDSDVSGQWFGGATLKARTCGGDCSHESFYFPRERELHKWDEPEAGLYFDFCKTAYKPYDIIVTTALIIMKNYFGDGIKVSSDGKLKDWSEAILICNAVLNYGADFELERW